MYILYDTPSLWLGLGHCAIWSPLGRIVTITTLQRNNWRRHNPPGLHAWFHLHPGKILELKMLVGEFYSKKITFVPLPNLHRGFPVMHFASPGCLWMPLLCSNRHMQCYNATTMWLNTTKLAELSHVFCYRSRCNAACRLHSWDDIQSGPFKLQKIIVDIKYPAHDLICDAIIHCAWSCDKGM